MMLPDVEVVAGLGKLALTFVLFPLAETQVLLLGGVRSTACSRPGLPSRPGFPITRCLLLPRALDCLLT